MGKPSPAHGTFSASAIANVETGVLLLCKECLVTAITDRRLDRTHLRVLACIVEHVNRHTAKAWPDRRTIATALGIEPVTVSNKLRELRLWGYLIAERERVPEANNRSLMVYTFGNIDHETIRREIEIYVERIKGKVTEGSDYCQSPDAVTITKGGDFETAKVTEDGARKSPYSVDSNSEKELRREVLAERSLARAAALTPSDGEARPAKRKARSTGKRPWSYVHDSEKDDLLERCKGYAAKRGWAPAFLAERLRAFAAYQNSRRIASADWWSELELWLGNPAHQPRTSRGRASTDDLAAQAFGGDSWERS